MGLKPFQRGYSGSFSTPLYCPWPHRGALSIPCASCGYFLQVSSSCCKVAVAMPAMIYMEAITLVTLTAITLATMTAVTQAMVLVSVEYLKCCRLTCIARGVIGLSLVVTSVFFLYIGCTSRDQSAQHDSGGV